MSAMFAFNEVLLEFGSQLLESVVEVTDEGIAGQHGEAPLQQVIGGDRFQRGRADGSRNCPT